MGLTAASFLIKGRASSLCASAVFGGTSKFSEPGDSYATDPSRFFFRLSPARGFFHFYVQPTQPHRKNEMKTQSWITLTAAVCGLIVAAGCATPFKYNPSHVQQYPAIANNEGLEIVDGTDVRPKKERRPKWKPVAEQVVANALEDELTHAKLFQHVTVKVRDTVSSVLRKFQSRSRSG